MKTAQSASSSIIGLSFDRKLVISDITLLFIMCTRADITVLSYHKCNKIIYITCWIVGKISEVEIDPESNIYRDQTSC